MATTLEELLVKMDLDSAKYRAELDKVVKSLDGLEEKVGTVTAIAEISFAKKLASSVGKLAGAAIDGAKSLFSFIEAGQRAGEQIERLSQQTGIAADALTTYTYAGDLLGTSSEAMGKGFAKLAKSMETAAGGSKEAQAGFDAIGVSATNASGAIRPMGDVIGDIADKFAGYEDGAGKSALAQKVLGRGAAELVPWLNLGRDGIKQWAQEAENLGLVLDAKTAKQMQTFEINLRRIEQAEKALSQDLTQTVAPIMQVFSDRIVDAATKGGLLRDALGFMGQGLVTVAFGARSAWAEVEILGARFQLFLDRHAHWANEELSFKQKLLLSIGQSAASEKQRADYLEGIRRKEIEDLLKISGLWNDLTQNKTKVAPPIIADPKGLALLQAELDRLRQEYADLNASIPREIVALPAPDKARLEEYIALPVAASREMRDKIAKELASIPKIEELLDSEKFRTAIGAWGAKGKEIADQARTLQRLISETKVKQTVGEGELKGIEGTTKALDEYRRGILALGGETEQARIKNRFLYGDLKELAAKYKLSGGNVDEYIARFVRVGRAYDETRSRLEALRKETELQSQRFEEANRIIESQENGLDKFRGSMEQLRQFRSQDLLTQQQYNRAVADGVTEFTGLADVGRGTAGLLSNSFAEFFTNFDKGVNQIASNFAKAMAAMVAQVIAAKLVGGIFSLLGGLIGAAAGPVGAVAGASLGGSVAGATDLPALLPTGTSFAALGANATAGQPFIVGEKGPELFVPRYAGTIVPNDKMASGGGATGARVDHYHHFDDDSQRRTLRNWWESELTDQAAREVA